jgi:hypothetical protein
MAQKTHREVKVPQMSASRLADYMAASHQARRGIIRSCKYQGTSRVIQYNAARATIADHLSNPNRSLETAQQALARLEAKVADDPFDAKVLEHNCDMVRRFVDRYDAMALPKAEPSRAAKFPPLSLGGTRVTFEPHVLLTRTTRTNKVRIGALMLRYKKGAAVNEEAALYQAAFIYGYLLRRQMEENTSPDPKLCLILDVHTNQTIEAPSKSGYMFKEMEAACSAVAERWPAIEPPADAVL